MLNENATSGATSAGNVASIAQPLNYSIQRRLPPTNIFTSSAPTNIIDKKKDKK